MAVKDLLDTAGLTTTYGSALFADHVPAVSADAVRLIEEAGYAVAGKTNLHEFAYGISSQNVHYGTVPNPVAPGRLAGGSSGGSAAAIAAGEVELALGSDSAGSIRIPAAWCGNVGFKPTRGLVSVEGCFPLAPSYDVVGPMASSVEGCERLLRALAPDFEPVELESLEELEVGIAWLDQAEPLVRQRVDEVAALFPRRRELALPLAPANRADFMREVADVHRALFPGNEQLYGENVRGKVERCLQVRDEEATAAERERADYFERVAEAVRRARPARDTDRPVRRTAGRGRRARDPGGGDLAHVPDQLARLAGARASRAARQRTACPPRSSSPLRRGKTPASSPPAACSNRCWRGSTGPLFPSNRLLLGRCAVTKPWRRRCEEDGGGLRQVASPEMPPAARRSRQACGPAGESAEPCGRGPSPARNSACRAPFGPQRVRRSDSSRRWERLSATAVRSRRGVVVGCEERRRARRQHSRGRRHGTVRASCRNGTVKACNSLLQGTGSLRCPAYGPEAVAASTAAS